MTRFAALLVFFAVGFASIATAKDRVTVFAAASLRSVLEDIAAQTGDNVVFSFGGSGAMARQVAAGAPADVVVLASADWMNWLAAQGLIAGKDVQIVARNALVVIGRGGTPPLASGAELVDRLHNERLAMGQRDAVPAGFYARQWLQSLGVWEALSDKLAETENVRAALALVARGQAEFGMVYATDALTEPAVDVVWAVPETSHDAILYPAVALTPAGQHYLDMLLSPPASTIFTAHGFGPLGK